MIQHFTVLLFKYSLVIAGRPNGWCLLNSNQRYDDGADVEYSKGLLEFRVYFLKMLHICKTQLLSLLPYCDSEKVGTSKKRALL